MKLKFTFWEISLNDRVLNYTFTFKEAHKWARNWMEENLNKHYTVFDQEADNFVNSDEVIYNGRDKVKIRECIVNDECKSPSAIVSMSYYHTED